MKNFEIFNNIYFRPFNFASSLKEILNRLFGEKNMAVQFNHLIVIPECIPLESLFLLSIDGVHPLSSECLQKSSDPILKKQKIIIARVLSEHKTSSNAIKLLEKELLISPMINFFQSSLMLEELKWLLNAYEYVHEHLKNRISGNIVLTHYESIQYSCSEFMENYQLLFRCLNGFIDNPQSEFLNLYCTSLFKALNVLMKLAGGRAFLADSIIEMLWLFELINKIYLQDHE